MTTYNSYEAAKIANPDCEIHKHCVNDEFATREESSKRPRDFLLAVCNPADYCMTVEKFLADGNNFVEGDVVLSGTRVKTISKNAINTMNMPSHCDKYTFILRAAALEEKKPRTKVEYAKCEFSHAWEAVKEHEENKNIFHSIDRDGVIEEFAICGYDMHVIGECARDGELYRRIETPMTEQDCFIQDCRKSTMVQDDVVAMSLFEAGCRFVN
jgi:hypothetical protein